MPRHARVKYETIFDVLKGLPIFNENGWLKRKTDPIWKEACRILKDINLHNLYIFVYQDRKNIKTNLMKYLNLEIVPPKPKKIKKEEPQPMYNSKWDDYEYYETLDNDDNQDNRGSDLTNLISMMESQEYKNSIQKFKILPFSIIYWHPEQIAIWKDLINIEPTVSLIVLDNLVTNVAENFISGNIYMFALTVQLKNTVILLAQMISDSTDSVEIEYFFNIWLQQNAPAPPEMVIGYSYSLLDAASLAFNFCTFDEYNLRCFKYLMHDISELPPTLIHIDLLGLIKVIDGWACLKNILQPVKDLYLCSIMYLSTVDNLDEFKETVVSLLTLCQSPYQSPETEVRRATLWENLITDNIQEMNQQYIQYLSGKNGSRSFSFLNIRQNPVTNTLPHDIYDFINQLKLQAFEICDFNMEPEKIANDYYCPIALENLIQLLIEFPSWTKVIAKKNECSTLVSSCSRKHLTALREIIDPVKPPQFLVYHLEKVKALTQLGTIFYNDSSKNRTDLPTVERKNNHSHLIQTISDKEQCDSRIEIKAPTTEETETAGNEELDLTSFKAAIYSTIHSLIDFDDCVNNILSTRMNSGQEMTVCKTLLDCCTEMKTYEKFIGSVAGRFCSTSEVFADSFREILIDCYNTVELFDKMELRNSSKLFAHLLISDSISWEIFSIFKLNEKDTTPPQGNFIRILLKEMMQHMGSSKLLEKLQNILHWPALRGLFPNSNAKEIQFASNFYKTVGLKSLCSLLKKKTQQNGESSSSNSSTSHVETEEVDTSCDYIVELRISKKNGNGPREERKKIILLK